MKSLIVLLFAMFTVQVFANTDEQGYTTEYACSSKATLTGAPVLSIVTANQERFLKSEGKQGVTYQSLALEEMNFIAETINDLTIYDSQAYHIIINEAKRTASILVKGRVGYTYECYETAAL